MKNYFATERGNRGIGERIKEDWDGSQPSDGWDSVADWALARYDLRIRAKFEAMGLKIESEGPITVESIREAVSSKSGLTIEELTPQGIAKALDAKLAAELSREMRLEVSTVFDQETLKQEIKNQVIDALGSGSGAGVVTGRTLHALRFAATFAKAGIVGDEKQTLINRYKQKKYRRSHRQIWQ
jgi:hypothetical protein